MTDIRAVIYARFSSDKQSEGSIEDQVALCRAFCERENFRVVGVYDDRAISGASTVNRAGWLKLMRDANADKFDVVVAEALDRISRDQEDLAGIYKRLRFKQIEIWTVQDGVAGEIHVGVKGLVGALYLKDLAQKTKRGQAGWYAMVATMAAALTVIARQRVNPASLKYRMSRPRSCGGYSKATRGGGRLATSRRSLTARGFLDRGAAHGTRQRLAVAESAPMASCKTHSISVASYGTGNHSLRTRKPAVA